MHGDIAVLVALNPNHGVASKSWQTKLGEIEAIGCGKPVTHARAIDVSLTAKIYHYMAGWASKVSGETVCPYPHRVVGFRRIR